LDRLRNQLLKNDRHVDDEAELPEEGRIAANTLNIRQTPTTDGKRIARPLKKGTKVRILDQSNGWYKVSTEIEGWVFGKYVENV